MNDEVIFSILSLCGILTIYWVWNNGSDCPSCHAKGSVKYYFYDPIRDFNVYKCSKCGKLFW